MGTRFTRISIVADGRQLDLSLPADQPLGEQFPLLMRLLSIPTESSPVHWALSSPETGQLNLNRSLDELGILDGRMLHLTAAQDSARPPQVDDVEGAIAEAVVEVAKGWTGESRRSGVAGLVAIVLAAAVLFCAMHPGELIAGLGALLVAAICVTIGVLMPQPAGWWPASVAVPAVAVASFGVDLGQAALPVIGMLAGSVGAAAVGLARKSPGVIAGGLAGVVLAGLGSTQSGLGVAGGPAAGAVLVLAVVLIGQAGPVALGVSGLVSLLIADERGDGVARTAVQQQVHRGQQVATGLVFGSSIGGAVAVSIMIIGRQAPDAHPELSWLVAAAGLWGALTFALRSRRFTRAIQVWPMLAVGVIGAMAAALSLPDWVDLTAAGGVGVTLSFLGLLLICVGALGFGSLGEVAKARTQRLLDVLEPVAVAILVPAVVLSYGVISVVTDLVS